MNYSTILLFSLAISLITGTLLFILGCLVRFQQALLLNNYIADLESNPIVEACESKLDNVNICATQTSFDSIYIGEWANYLGSLVILLGFLIMFYSTMGLFGLLRGSRISLLLMFFLLLAAMVFEFFIFEVLLGDDNSFHEQAREELGERLASEYTLNDESNEFTRIMNAVMLKGRCCGIEGPDDFALNETLHLHGHKHVLQIPPACCDIQDFNSPLVGFFELLRCSEDSLAARIFRKGCYHVLHVHFYDSYGEAAYGNIIFVMLWEGIQEILIFMIVLKRKEEKLKKSNKSSSGSGVQKIKEVAKPEKKPGSLSGSGTHEKASTEIW
ncbi:hypothetical protein RRG08_005521 [Elysia crispata]|uniref:Tetraspanin n=1 Tax=Elysia crispata TaxID=231223 RepID=A0AAE0XR78_9GAST|nr:hypothetical protein RRG08_005521 [Elysia crispata]